MKKEFTKAGQKPYENSAGSISKKLKARVTAVNDIMVSIRMPKSLVIELKALAKTQHFLDLSEEVRSIVRQKWLSHISPEVFELKKLRENIEDEIKLKSAKKVHEEVTKELEKIRFHLKKEGLADDK